MPVGNHFAQLVVPSFSLAPQPAASVAAGNMIVTYSAESSAARWQPSIRVGSPAPDSEELALADALCRLTIMENGLERAESSYAYAGKSYRLVEVESGKWRVFDGDTYLGAVVALADGGAEYTIAFAGEERQDDEPASGDWQSMLEYLIDNTAPPVGA